MDNVYEQLKQQFREKKNLNELFVKETVDVHRSIPDIYREIAFGEMPISQFAQQAKQG